MLVDIGEFIDNPKSRFFPIIAQVVGLNALDLFESVCGNPFQLPTFNSTLKSFRGFADWKHLTIGGLVASSNHKFPH